jgi:hypothetical protein
LNNRIVIAAMLAGLAFQPAIAADTAAAPPADSKSPASPAGQTAPAAKEAAAQSADAAKNAEALAKVPKLTVEQILARNAEARGGVAAWKGIQTLSFSGLMDAGKERAQPGNRVPGDPHLSKSEQRKARMELQKATAEAKTIQLPFTLDLARGRKSRLEIKVKDQTAVQVYDGTAGWKLRPYIGKTSPEPFSPEELKSAAAQQELDGPLLDADAKGNKIESDGVEMVDGNPAYKLKVTEKSGVVRHVWVDATTFLDLRVDGVRRWDGKERPLYTYFRDWRTVNGVKIPFLQENKLEGLKDSNKIQIEKVQVNPKLDADRFAKPEDKAAPAKG